ncbi:MFS transporter [Streptomyces sp. MMBL 11-3]|uniref:MFS transporter n=1 Tax=Streptomyces sp. MMBL 11-3 TaxID=3382639 RepID=UPI0039B42920
MPPATPVREARAVSRETAGPVSRLFLPLIALCTAVTVANVYLAASLLPLIAEDFGSTASGVAWIASVAQLGYALGLLFFAPLGDSFSRRRMVGVLSLVTGAALFVGAVSGGTHVLAAAVLVASAVTVVPQLLVPLVAERAPAHHRARHVAAVVAGLFLGIVAARVLGGVLGQAFGWRAVFAGAAVLTALTGVVTSFVLPVERRRREGPLFAGLAAMPGLVRRSPGLWRACVRQAGMYGAWSAIWTSLALLLTNSSYGLSTATAGLFGLFGLTASAVAPLAGGLVDRFGAAKVVAVSYLLAAVSVLLFWLGGHVMAALCAAAVLVHAALVASQVANQTQVLTTTAVPATANTAYVVSAFAGGALASAAAGPAYGHGGWGAVCAVAGAWLLLCWTATAVRRRASAGAVPQV